MSPISLLRAPATAGSRFVACSSGRSPQSRPARRSRVAVMPGERARTASSARFFLAEIVMAGSARSKCRKAAEQGEVEPAQPLTAQCQCLRLRRLFAPE